MIPSGHIPALKLQPLKYYNINLAFSRLFGKPEDSVPDILGVYLVGCFPKLGHHELDFTEKRVVLLRCSHWPLAYSCPSTCFECLVRLWTSFLRGWLLMDASWLISASWGEPWLGWSSPIQSALGIKWSSSWPDWPSALPTLTEMCH